MKVKVKNKSNFFIRLGVLLIISAAVILPTAAQNINHHLGTLRHPIFDSRMSKREALDGLDPNCPLEIRRRQRIVTLKYYSFDKLIHQGQLVIDVDLVKDIKKIFKAALQEKFPIYSVIPISAAQFRQDGRWNDDLSMIADNSSAFNFREKTGGGALSNHAYGRAVDINTVQNPYLKGTILLPPNGVYQPNSAGTLTKDSPLVKMFIALGWTWGGNWTSPIDYQHFEKTLPVTVQKQ
ncbi:MAG: M15 family metallopeptidase [Acidobacteriota bacterium]|nr:M15 family metallopeptidase [Acidobacteriota bacterium]